MVSILCIAASMVCFAMAILGLISPRAVFWRGPRNIWLIFGTYTTLSVAAMAFPSISAKIIHQQTSEPQAVKALSKPGPPEGHISSVEANKKGNVTDMEKRLIECSLIQHEEKNKFWQSFVLRIPNRISEEDIRSIANKVKNDSESTFERTFVAFLLPNMVLGKDVWATANFNPELKIVIYGATVDRAESMLQASRNVARPGEILQGTWEFIGAGANHTSLVVSEGRLYREVNYGDGEGLRILMEERIEDGIVRILEAGCATREWYFVNSDGDLEIWDPEGLIMTGLRVQREN